MGIEQNHPLYDENVDRWTVCRDAFEGEYVIKKKSTVYLPILAGMSGLDYDNYLRRARFLGATGATVRAITGVLFIKNPKITTGDLVPTDDIDGSLTTLPSFHQQLASEFLVSGRPGVWVDWDNSRNLPYVKLVRASDVVNWTPSDKGLQRVVIEQCYYQEAQDDIYKKEKVRSRIELFMDNGVFKTREWILQKNGKGKDEWTAKPVVTPFYRGGVPVTTFPFTFCTETGLNTEIHAPQIEPVAHLNIGHYMNSADLAWGGHFACLPTPWITGIDKPDKPIAIGPTSAIIISEADAKVGMLQYDGKSLDVMLRIMADQERQMAELGTRFFEKAGVETAEAKRLRMSASTSSLLNLASMTSLGMKWTLEQMNLWMQVDDEYAYELDKNFIPDRITPAEMKQLLELLQAGKISVEAFLFNLERGGLYPEGHSAEEEKNKLSEGTE